jgi:hypothetical protein
MVSYKEKLEEELAVKLGEDLKYQDEEIAAVNIVDMSRFRFEHGPGFIEKLSRIKGPKQIEVEGKRVLVKLSLQVKMDKCTDSGLI